jgi:single-strand DNA-binding protein
VLDNAVTLVGNTTREVEVRYTTSGRAVAAFGLAVNRRWMVEGEWQEQTSFFDVDAWSDLGENVAESITKGTRVVVVGRLEQRSWEDDEGTKQYRVTVVADEVSPSLRWASCEVTRNERVAVEDETPAPARKGRSPLKAAG